MTPTALGVLAGLHRYPVKSMLGERLRHAFIDDRGLEGDRLWSVRDSDGKFGSGKSTRRFRKMEGLLDLVAQYDGATPVVSFPGGRTLRGDQEEMHEALTDHVGRAVTLGREQDVSHFDEGPVHLVTTSSLRCLREAVGHDVEERRLRPNLLIDTGGGTGFVEDTWVGRRIAVGAEVLLGICSPMPRCVMLDLPQLSLAADGNLLKNLRAMNESRIGVVAEVLQPGTVRVGDMVRVAPQNMMVQPAEPGGSER